MKERPILFSGEMVRAILDGRKSMTRRVMKVQPPSDGYSLATCISTTWPKSEEGKSHWVKVDNSRGFPNIVENQGIYFSCPYGQVGDRLWLRETWRKPEYHEYDQTVEFEYKASCDYPDEVKWRPSIHMPREASRITLEIIEVRVERLQEVTGEDAWQEGVSTNTEYAEYAVRLETPPVTSRHYFKHLWDSINGKKYPWDSNPYVWVIGFKRVS